MIYGRIKIAPLIDRHFGLDRVVEAFRADIDDPTCIKVVLEP